MFNFNFFFDDGIFYVKILFGEIYWRKEDFDNLIVNYFIVKIRRLLFLYFYCEYFS